MKSHSKNFRLNKRELAEMLGISYSTIYLWEKNRPNLYKLILDGLKYREFKTIIKEIVEF